MTIKILYIGNKLAKHGNNPTGIDVVGKYFESEGYRMQYASEKKNKFLRILEMLYKVLTVKQVDYVLIDTYSTSNFWYAFIVSVVCNLRKLSYIPICRGGSLNIRIKKNPYCSKLIFSKAYANVAPSAYTYNMLKELDMPNLVQISNTIEVAKYPFRNASEFRPRLLWVRALVSIYNPEMAIRVFKKVKEKYPDATLTMVGPFKEIAREKMEQMARKHRVEVLFTGKLSKEEWIKLSEDYDIFLNTTNIDNMPVSVLEAMALGLVVVSTNVGGVPYIIENNKTGLLVNADDSEEMAAKIEYIVDNQDFSEQLTKNARNFAEKLDWKNIKNDWYKLLHER